VVGIAWKSPSGRDADYAALGVLGTILGSGKTSRFYRALTDKNLALNVSASAGFFHDPSLFNVYASVAPGVEHSEVERVLLEEIERVKKDGVTDQEVATALAKYEASTAYGRDGSFAIASNLNETIAAGDWTLYYTLDDATRKVTAADVKRVANAYFDAARSTTGWFVPLPATAPDAESAPAAK
jgi:zinc protease